MTTFAERLSSQTGILASLGTGAAFLVTGTIYVTSLVNEYRAIPGKLATIEERLTKLETQSVSATGLQGEKGEPGARGEKGEKGDPGEKGEKGDPGIAGAAGSGVDLTAIVRRLETLERTKAAVSSNQASSLGGTSIPNVACVTVPEEQVETALIMGEAQRVCGVDGKLRGYVTSMQKDEFVRFKSGSGNYQCELNNECNFLKTDEAYFMLDEVSKAVDGKLAAKFSMYPR